MPMLDKALNTVIMPFGLKLRRTGRYILSHKNSFLIRVQLLDNAIMEWNVTVENTGNDCLNAVAQKLELRETKYFGLHYLNKQMKIRWVELDKPLKKQFDKHAHGPNLYFGVMYYVANIDSLMQEITRYLFYLQLKNNVIDGMLKCNKEEAIELASYMLQAEFGDHDPHEHVVGYFRDYILFPETLTPDEAHLDSLTVQAIDHHKRHRSLSPSDAEYNYILKAIHLSGFSEDIYPAKNSFGNDVIVGCSFAGVVIKSQHPDETTMRSACYEWQIVEHLSHSKLTLSIEIRREDASFSLFQFLMEDADTAKYLCRMCESLKKFYLQNKETTRQLPLESASTLIRRPTLRRNLEIENEEIVQPMAAAQPGPADFVSSQDNLEMYGADASRYYSSQNSLDHDAYVSQNSLNHLPQQEARYSNGFGGSVYSSTSINSLALSHAGRPSPANSNLSINSSQQRGINRPGLPMYRSSPDYEVAMRQRRRYSSYLESNNANVMHQSSNQQHPATNVPQPNLKPRPHSMIYSQQELVHQATHGPYYAQYPPQHPPLLYRRSQPPLDSSQGQVYNRFQWDRSHESLSPPGGSQIVDLRLTIPLEGKELPSMSGSTPELTIQQQQGRPFFVSEIQLHRHFQNSQPVQQGAGSTSTPDLSQHRQAVSASSPDLHLVNNQPARPHRPLPPVESFAEDYNGQRMMSRVLGNHMQANPDAVVMRKEHPQGRPASTSYDRSIQQHKQTPAQNVKAYLEQVGYDHHGQSKDPAGYNPYSRPLAGSREHLIKQESFEQQQYGSQQRIPTLADSHGSGEQFLQYSDTHLALQQHTNVHHTAAPSTATMVVHSSGSESEVTNDYILSQQLQDQAIQQARFNRSQEYIGPNRNSQHEERNQLVDSLQQININEYLRGAESGGSGGANYRPPPPYPDNFVGVEQPQQVPPRQEPDVPHHILPEMVPHHQSQTIPQEETSQLRGPPPPYHTPSPSVVVQESETYQVEEEKPNEASGDTFQNARRSTIRKMNPLKFAAMNGLSVNQRPATPVKGEPDERALNLQTKVEEGHVLTEYDQIARTRLDDHELESFTSRDRVKEVVPYRNCRVEITPSSDNPLGYINASHVKALVAGKQWRYIACQTPMEGFQDELWDAVWLNNVSIIVLITKEIEHGKSRCARYWPSSEDNQDIPSAVFGNYRVMCRFDSCHPSGVHDSIVTRNLVLERVGGSEKRTVWMLQYIGWPDTGVPKETDGFLAFLEELESVRRLAEEHTDVDAAPSPVLVQCASGSGRSGVLILAELMVQCLEHNQDTTVSEMLTLIRQQRMHFVQTFSQYNFVYKILISFLRKSRLI